MNIVDMHCDTIVEMYNSKQNLYKNNLHIDINKMEKGDYLLQNMAIFLDSTIEENLEDKAKLIIDFYDRETEKYNINKVYKYKDINFDSINTMLTIEDSAIVPYSSLDDFYNKVVRMITITWNYQN